MASKEFSRPRPYPLRFGKREQRNIERLFMDRAVYDGSAFNQAKVASIVYDFSVSGGAVSTIALAMNTGLQIPANSIVVAVHADVQTTAASLGSATAQLKLATDGALTNAIAVADLTAGVKVVGLTANTTLVPLKTTVAQDFQLAIAVAALTAGKIRFYVAWLPST